MPSSTAKQFTIRERCIGGPALYVRVSQVTDYGMGDFGWAAWRKAQPDEIAEAIVKLQELNKE